MHARAYRAALAIGRHGQQFIAHLEIDGGGVASPFYKQHQQQGVSGWATQSDSARAHTTYKHMARIDESARILFV